MHPESDQNPIEGTSLLSTNRLALRHFTPRDGAGLYSYLSDPAVVRFEPYAPMPREACDAAAQSFCESEDFWAICLEDGTLIGQVYLAEGDRQTWELGYVFHAAYHRQGYATEACRALLAWAYGPKKAHRVYAQCNPANTASWRLLERLGMRREAHHIQDMYFDKNTRDRPLWQDTYVYAMLAAEWK